MAAATPARAVPRARHALIAALLVVATGFFVVGTTIERAGGEAGEAPGAHQEAGEEGEGRAETTLGLNLESPWVVGIVALGSLALAGGLVVLGARLLLPVAVISGAATLLDLLEVLRQAEHARYGILALALAAAAAHAAAAILAALALRGQTEPGGVGTPLSRTNV